MKPATNGHFAPGILPAAMVSSPKNRTNLSRSRGSRGRKRKFPGFFASFLAFVYQYFISPPRERPPPRKPIGVSPFRLDTRVLYVYTDSMKIKVTLTLERELWLP